MRTCKVCGKEKPLESFPISDRQMGYRRRDCHDCYKARHRAYYDSRGYEYRERIGRTYAARRENVVNHYGGKCTCCGIDDDRFLTIEHKDGDGAKMRPIHGKGRQFYAWLVANNFPDNFELLCFNCNTGKYRNGGICPHKEGSTTIPEGSRAK